MIKLLLSILSVSRALRTKPSPSFKTITGPSELKEYPFSPKDFVEFWSSLGYTTKLKPGSGLDFRNYHKSSKSGPNGPALWTSFNDLLSLDPDILSDIYIMGGGKLKGYIELLLKYSEFLNHYFRAHSGLIRKLIYFSDREGKTREVAIFDYFSQTSLIPLHKYLFKVLKKIPQDFTFDQTGFERSLKGAEIYYSIDLTAFTDRFPVRLNKDLIEVRIGPERANA